MKLNELKKLIDELVEDGKGEMEVLLSEDAEGNGFNDIDELGVSHCHYDTPVHPDDIGEEYDEEDLEEKVIIWSV
ncbi:hypothetical protein ACU3L3_07080 [Priestia endophytica]